MSFRLLIECSKDIDSLKINFSDGTSVINEKKNDEPIKETKKETKKEIVKHEVNEPKPPNVHIEPRKKLESYLSYEENTTTSPDVVIKPHIEEILRPPKVTDELQNLDL